LIEDALQVVNGCTAVRGGEVGQSAIGKGPARSVERLVMDVHGIDVVEGFPAQAASIQITDAVAFSKKPCLLQTNRISRRTAGRQPVLFFLPGQLIGRGGKYWLFSSHLRSP